MGLYENFIKEFALRLNRLRLAQIVRRVSESYTSKMFFACQLDCFQKHFSSLETIIYSSNNTLHVSFRHSDVGESRAFVQATIDQVKDSVDAVLFLKVLDDGTREGFRLW